MLFTCLFALKYDFYMAICSKVCLVHDYVLWCESMFYTWLCALKRKYVLYMTIALKRTYDLSLVYDHISWPIHPAMPEPIRRIFFWATFYSCKWYLWGMAVTANQVKMSYGVGIHSDLSENAFAPSAGLPCTTRQCSARSLACPSLRYVLGQLRVYCILWFTSIACCMVLADIASYVYSVYRYIVRYVDLSAAWY